MRGYREKVSVEDIKGIKFIRSPQRKYYHSPSLIKRKASKKDESYSAVRVCRKRTHAPPLVR